MVLADVLAPLLLLVRAARCIMSSFTADARKLPVSSSLRCVCVERFPDHRVTTIVTRNQEGGSLVQELIPLEWSHLYMLSGRGVNSAAVVMVGLFLAASLLRAADMAAGVCVCARCYLLRPLPCSALSPGVSATRFEMDHSLLPSCGQRFLLLFCRPPTTVPKKRVLRA